jgi:hypothetical protein
MPLIDPLCQLPVWTLPPSGALTSGGPPAVAAVTVIDWSGPSCHAPLASSYVG